MPLTGKASSRILCASPKRPSKEVVVEMIQRLIAFCFCYFRGSPIGQTCCSSTLSFVILLDNH